MCIAYLPVSASVIILVRFVCGIYGLAPRFYHTRRFVETSCSRRESECFDFDGECSDGECSEI